LGLAAKLKQVIGDWDGEVGAQIEARAAALAVSDDLFECIDWGVGTLSCPQRPFFFSREV
jgi:hypothetical protein